MAMMDLLVELKVAIKLEWERLDCFKLNNFTEACSAKWVPEALAKIPYICNTNFASAHKCPFCWACLCLIQSDIVIKVTTKGSDLSNFQAGITKSQTRLILTSLSLCSMSGKETLGIKFVHYNKFITYPSIKT